MLHKFKKGIAAIICLVMLFAVAGMLVGCGYRCRCDTGFNANSVSDRTEDGEFIMSGENFSCWAARLNHCSWIVGLFGGCPVVDMLPPPIIIIRGNKVAVVDCISVYGTEHITFESFSRQGSFYRWQRGQRELYFSRFDDELYVILTMSYM